MLKNILTQSLQVPESQDHVIDIQRIKGHSIVFMNYCQNFLEILEIIMNTKRSS